MPRTTTPSLVCLLAVAGLTLLATGCEQKSPEEEIAEARSKYEATLVGWVVRDTGPVPVAVGEAEVVAEAGEDVAPAETPATGAEQVEGEVVEDMALAPPAALPKDVILTINVYHTAADPLPGVTVDVTHAGADETEKGRHRVFLDTSRVARGQHAQIDEVLSGLEVDAGDKFHVEVRHPVPAEERGEYREFAGE